MKNICSIIRTIFILTAMFVCATLHAAIKTGKLGQNVEYEWNTATGEGRIWGEGEIDISYSYYSSPFKNTHIQKVTIEKGITSLGQVFSGYC